MNQLINFSFKYGQYRFAIPVLLLGFSLQYILIAFFLPEFLQYSEGIKNPDQLFSYNFDYLANLYEKLGPDGRNFYTKMLLVDFAYTSISAIGFSFLLAVLVAKRTWIILLPFLLALSDICENVAQLILLSQFPSISPTLAVISSIFSSIKMLLSLICIVLISFYILRGLILWIKKRL